MKKLHPELDRLSKSDASELAEGLFNQASDPAWLEGITESGDSVSGSTKSRDIS